MRYAAQISSRCTQSRLSRPRPVDPHLLDVARRLADRRPRGDPRRRPARARRRRRPGGRRPHHRRARPGVVGQPGDLVLGVGVESAEAAADARARRRGGAAGVVLRRSAPGAARPGPRHALGLALVELAEQASWAHLVWLLRGVLDRAAADRRREPTARSRTTCSRSPTRRRPGRRPGDHRGRPVARARLLLAAGPRRPGPRLDHRRPPGARRGPRDPARPRACSGGSPARPSPSSSRPGGGLRARLVIPVRAGGEWLGSIWAVVEERPPAVCGR